MLWHGAKELGDICIDEFFRMLERDQYKIQYRVMLARYRGRTICPDCEGSRLRPEAAYVKVGGASITDLVNKPISELRDFSTICNSRPTTPRWRHASCQKSPAASISSAMWDWAT